MQVWYERNYFQILLCRAFLLTFGKVSGGFNGVERSVAEQSDSLWTRIHWHLISLAGWEKLMSCYLGCRVDPCKRVILIPVMKNTDSQT